MPNHLALAYRISRLDDSLNKKLYGVVFLQLPSSSRPNGLMSTIKKEEERKKVERRVLNGRKLSRAIRRKEKKRGLVVWRPL